MEDKTWQYQESKHFPADQCRILSDSFYILNIIWNLNKGKKHDSSLWRRGSGAQAEKDFNFLVPIRLDNHLENWKKWPQCTGTVYLCILASSRYKSQHKEGALEPKVDDLQLRLHVLKEEENHLKVNIEYTEVWRFSFAGLLITFVKQRNTKSVQRDCLIACALYSHPSPPVGFWIRIPNTSLLFEQFCCRSLAVRCHLSHPSLFNSGTWLFSPPFHGERHSPVLWVEPRAAGSNKIWFLYPLLPLICYVTLDKYFSPLSNPVIWHWQDWLISKEPFQP